MKFHGHTICYENFPKDLATCNTKGQPWTRQGRKITIKWKTASLIPGNFIHKLDMGQMTHAKFGVNWIRGSM